MERYQVDNILTKKKNTKIKIINYEREIHEDQKRDHDIN